jgi:hypothetical protein
VRHRENVLALTVAAGLISSAALAKPHCSLGKIYYRSKHACLAKEVAIDRGIYHYRHHIAAEAAGTTLVRRSARLRLGRTGGGNSGTTRAPRAHWHGFSSGAERK